jgi:hypothetical protein
MQSEWELTRRVLLQRAAFTGALVLVPGELAPSKAAARPARRPRRNARETFGTELDYYRSDPGHLDARLAVCAAAGYTTIQTYVPWNVHENTRGRLDFTGHTKPVIVNDHFHEYQIETPDQEISAAGLPSRVIANTDLLGYIEVCARHGFKVILRPGPFISDEWRSGGLPDWLAIAYPDIFMRGPHGTTLEPGFPFSPPVGAITGGGPLYYFAGPFLGFTYTEGINDGDVADMSMLGRTPRLAGSRLAHSERVADTAIVWPPEYLYAPYESTKYGFQRDVRGVIESDIPALATLLIRAGLAFDLLDTDVAQPADYSRYPTVWLACADVPPRSCQQALIDYVRGGGKLICWGAPPTLDEDYAPCTLLRDALYPEALATHYPQDAQTVSVLGTPVQVWRGVQTFKLSAASTPIARRAGRACGYPRRAGRGRAVLLGTGRSPTRYRGGSAMCSRVRTRPSRWSSRGPRARAPRRSCSSTTTPTSAVEAR